MRSGADPRGGAGARDGLAGLGIAAVALICCAALPLLVGALGSLALGAWLGVAAGAVVLVVAAAGVVTARRRKRCAIAPRPEPK